MSYIPLTGKEFVQLLNEPRDQMETFGALVEASGALVKISGALVETIGGLIGGP